MERVFCNGRKSFCENPEECSRCDFADGSGSIEEWTLNNFLSSFFGEGYNLDRLSELVKADKAGKCIILPVKPGGRVRFAGNPTAKPEGVEIVSIYPDGKITYTFCKRTLEYVDDWFEDTAESYVPVQEGDSDG